MREQDFEEVVFLKAVDIWDKGKMATLLIDSHQQFVVEVGKAEGFNREIRLYVTGYWVTICGEENTFPYDGDDKPDYDNAFLTLEEVVTYINHIVLKGERK